MQLQQNLWLHLFMLADSISKEALQNMRIVMLLLVFGLSAAGGGAGVALNIVHLERPAVKPNSSLFLAMGGAPRLYADTNQSVPQDAINAALDHRDVDELKVAASKDADDRKLIHDQLYKLETENTNRYNLLTSRMDINDAKQAWILSLGGGLLTLISASSALITIGDQIKRRKEAK